MLAGSKNAKPAKKPVTSHPAFKWIVALWFAALLGIGSLILPIALIEKLVVTLGLPAIVEATQPPLGFTARLAIALAFTICGALLGLFAARQIARSNSTEAPPRSIKPSDFANRGNVRQPLKAHEELGQDGFDGAPSGRRRALSLKEEERPSEFLRQAAPLPGHDDHGHEFSGHDDDDYVEFDDEDDALNLDVDVELTETKLETPHAPQIFTESKDLPQHDDEADESSEETHLADLKNSFQPFPELASDEPEEEEIQSFEPAPEAVELEEEAQPVPESEPLAFSPPSMVTETVDEAEEENPVPTATIEAPAPAPAPAPAANMQTSALAAHLAQEAGEDDSVPLAELGLVQLVQRLATTIEKHREWSASQPSSSPAASSIAPVALAAATAHPSPLAGFESVDASEAIEARSAYFSAPPATPAAKDDSEAEVPAPEEVAAEPVQSFAAPAQSAIKETSEPEAETAIEPSSEPARQEFLPSQAAPAPAPKPLAPLATLAPHEDEEDEDDDHMAALTASFALPTPPSRTAKAEAQPAAAMDTAQPGAFSKPAPIAAAEPAAEAPKEDSEADAQAETGAADSAEDSANGEDGFASLTKLSNPFARPAQEFVRIENEPEPSSTESAVVFPAEKAASAAPRAFDPPGGSPANAPRPSGDEADRALRDALMNLQRMGKTG